MRRILTVVTVVIMTALSAYSQPQAANAGIAPCTLKTAPALRGVKLGMTPEELFALFPGSDEDGSKSHSVAKGANYPNFGVTGFQIYPSHYSTRERFAGIAFFNFIFLDGRVAQYEVEYMGSPNGPTWRNVDEFIAKIADAFKLPAAANWPSQPYTTPSSKELKCDGFNVRASNMNLRGNLTVSTLDAPSKIQQERRAAFDEKIRRDFRP